MRLKDIREESELKQFTVSQLLDVARGTYSLWELGINIIPLKNLCDYADYFKYSIDYVLGLTNNRNIKVNKGLNLQTLGNNMKTVRLKHNLSQENIADLLGVSQACIVRYEKGLICISTSNLYKFCKEFHVSMSAICGKSRK